MWVSCDFVCPHHNFKRWFHVCTSMAITKNRVKPCEPNAWNCDAFSFSWSLISGMPFKNVITLLLFRSLLSLSDGPLYFLYECILTLVLGNYIWHNICLYNVEMHKQPFSDQTPAFPVYWPVLYFLSPPHFLFCICFTLISILILSLIHPVFLCLSFSFSPDILFFYPFFLPCLDHTSLFMYLFVLFVFCLNKTSDPPINRPEPWSMTTSPFCGKPPSVMDDLFISALPRLFSLSACSSLLLKMVTPHSLFTLFGMFLLALPLFCFVSVILIIIHVLLVILFKVNMKST